MGAVYEVEHTKLGVRYAMKTFTLQEGHVELFRKRFSAEGKILARLNHPNLVRVIATLIRRKVIGYWRKRQARAVDEHVSIDNPDAGIEIADNLDAGLELDAKWQIARHEAAVEHALCKTALSAKTKDVYRAYVIEEMPLKEVMKKFGVSEAVVYQSKTRVSKMIAALESEYAAEG